ncbi:undecaprenyldiphospho-muramoylpentapeptide beta-N-acetylglucosaminyltransferase [Christiangramia sabulilitoris]|uniref:UDP-N-acetylglucosamine--N-acetylmuramyl-(pentapeptide) pyrophosphoryl-undecaprenol N-acetylglucosamine transferase n=1 Tax=Christiangramia sabulilitoris TaxID=2583991 RepID=A0A550I3R5_9FLAO|nr:undecaprenyldiphospho-muramoylpentapeptide beta-N-acetylglucosaminyltransferase [Christiangramia sabulilitoris]TRO65624.1 undecaprenyldiphospho-muramoylpentapeptide beta-N-acetylglucosaminyltransferase [Christiangramia sabulilitoris]
MKENLRVILSGGGTGGHIYPAIAIADEIKRRYPAAEILFVGAKDRMEMEKVPQAGYEIEGLWISGVDRSFSLKNFIFPFKLMSSLSRSRKIIKKFNPDIVIGTGGFASGPLLRVAISSGIPTLIQEQNSLPGITNRILAKYADTICAAYEKVKEVFPPEKTIITGNPVRQDLLEVNKLREEALSHFNLSKDKKTVLVLGGSLGARRINKLIENDLKRFKDDDVQLIWQIGKLYYGEYKKYDSVNVRAKEFINRMDYAYAAADVIISRAGAGSVSELCIVGKPVLFIPSPNVAENHQAKNAMAVTDHDAALMITEDELAERFEPCFFSLLKDERAMARFAQNIKKLALPNATSDIVDEVEKLINKK